MVSLSIISFIALYGSTVSAAAAGVCGKAPYKDLLFLSNYAPAESYCTKHYPQPVATVTVTSAPKKRAVDAKSTTPACDKTCSSWASVTSKAASFVSTLCSCIETPKTTTVTVKPTTTTTTTKPTTTTTTTTTPTTTTTTTTSAAAPTCTLPSENQGFGNCQCQYQTTCGQSCLGDDLDVTTQQRDASACQDHCDNFYGTGTVCSNYTYDERTGTCYVEGINCVVQANPGFLTGKRRANTCDFPACNPPSS